MGMEPGSFEYYYIKVKLLLMYYKIQETGAIRIPHFNELLKIL
jgi:hypothetical protein